MSSRDYDGVFLAPESIVVCPALAGFVLNENARTGSRSDGLPDPGPKAPDFSAAGATGEIL